MSQDEPELSPWSPRTIAIGHALTPLLDYPDRIPLHIMESVRTALIPVYKGKKPSDDTVRNLLHSFRAEGLYGIEHSKHRDKGRSTLPPLLAQHIRDLLITTRLSKKKIQEDAQAYAREILELDGTLPTYDQILFIDQQIPADIKTLGQKGVKAYRNEHELVVRFEAEFANQLWQGDNHRLNILVLSANGGKPYRPWISAFLDDYSRAIPGIHLSRVDPGSRGIALALRNAMTTKPQADWVMKGIADAVYFDNGKDYLSKHIANVCLHYKIDVMVHEPYLPRAKGKIEQWFNTMDEQCLSGLDGYVGRNLGERPEKPTAKYTLEQLVAIIEDWIVTKYHETVHSTTRMKPRTRWAASANHRLLQLIDESNERNLDFLLKSDNRTVSHEGIRFNNRLYSDPEYLVETVAKVGNRVRIFFDSADHEKIYVYKTSDGPEKWTYICTAYPRETYALNNANRRAVAAGSRKRREPKLAEVQAAKGRVAAAKKDKNGKTAPAHLPVETSPPSPTTSASSASPKAPASQPWSPPTLVRLNDLLGNT